MKPGLENLSPILKGIHPAIPPKMLQNRLWARLKTDTSIYQKPPASGLRDHTLIGHSSLLIGNWWETLVLTDPVWSRQGIILSFMGPKRCWTSFGFRRITTLRCHIVITHDHYDHLDKRNTIRSFLQMGISISFLLEGRWLRTSWRLGYILKLHLWTGLGRVMITPWCILTATPPGIFPVAVLSVRNETMVVILWSRAKAQYIFSERAIQAGFPVLGYQRCFGPFDLRRARNWGAYGQYWADIA